MAVVETFTFCTIPLYSLPPPPLQKPPVGRVRAKGKREEGPALGKAREWPGSQGSRADGGPRGAQRRGLQGCPCTALGGSSSFLLRS